MKLSIGSSIVYTSAAGTRKAVVRDIAIGPTAKPGFSNTWLTLDVPVQDGVTYKHMVLIPGDNGSLAAFRIQLA